MVLMVFVIKRDGEMQNVGARPKIFELANKNGVKVFPRNTAEGNIEVIAKGSEDDIRLFWKCVKKADLRPLANPKDKGTYEVGKLELYTSDVEPDFTYFAGSTTMEQVSKGTYFLSSIDSRLANLPENLADAIHNKEKRKKKKK